MPSLISLSRFFLFSSLFLTPLLSYGFNLGFEQIKIVFFIFSISLSALCLELHKIKSNKQPFKWTKIRIFSWVFILSLSFSTFFSLDPPSSLLGKPPYFQGLIVYFYLGILSLLVFDLKIKLSEISLSLTISVLVVSLLALKDFIALTFFNQPVLAYSGRVVSTFGQPNFYAGFIALAIPFILFNLQKNAYFKLSVFSLLIGILAIFVSYSRAAELMLIVLLILYLAYFLPKKPKIFFFLLITLLVLILTLTSIRYKVGPVWAEFIQPQNQLWIEQNSPEKRIFIWQIALKVISSRPLFGVGLENFDLSYADYFKSLNYSILQDPRSLTLKDLTVNRAHSYLLDLLVWGGVVSFLSWTYLFYLILKKSLKNRAFLNYLIIFLIYSAIQIQSISHLILFWTIIGLADNLPKSSS